MTTMGFEGRVAIVTGAGGNPGLGRAHAMLLASRGAKVVVNDLGVGSDGSGTHPHRAQATVDEILAAGGEAVADDHSVADEEGAKAIIQTAIDTWGRLDVLVNNAGIGVVSDIDEITGSHLEKVVAVHFMGPLWTCRAAWPIMKEAGYGRIVNTTSGGMWGQPGLTLYGACKFGQFGLTRGLAVEGAQYGIKVNSVSPGGHSNSFDRFYTVHDAEALAAFMGDQPAELVSPAVGYLAHEDCRVTGANFDATGGMVDARLFGVTPGYVNPNLTIEDVRDNLDQIVDADTMRVIAHPLDPMETGNNEFVKILEARPYEAL